MSEEVAGGNLAETSDRCAERASLMASSYLHSRDGFGALRQHQGILRESLRLALESVLIVLPRSDLVSGWVIDEEFLHFALRGPVRLQHGRFMSRILANPASFDPRCVWALFWAIAKAEHQFLHRFVPYWSHEERLTGHFVSQVVERTEEFAPDWLTLTGAVDGRRPGIKVLYADTAAARREGATGADFGLILHAQYSDSEEFIKVARFQAKKVGSSGSARIDLDQAEILQAREGLGYFVFYHSYDRGGWNLAPTVRPATAYQYAVSARREKLPGSRRQELGSQDLPARDDGFDFATFMTFGLADQSAAHGLVAATPEEAVSTIMADRQPLPSPTRLLIISLGQAVDTVPWSDFLREHTHGAG